MRYYSHYVLLHQYLFIGDNKMHIIYDLTTMTYHVINNIDNILFSALSWKTCQDYIDDNSR